MAQFVVLFQDNDAFTDQRQKHMQDHLKFLAVNADKVISAGPLFSKDGEPAGGIWHVSASDLASVEALIKEDPFWPTGLRKDVQILEWRQVFRDGHAL